MVATIEIILGLAIFITEILNIIVEFWYMNVFGGIWGSIILFINWITIYTTVCCSPTIGASTCSLVWNILTIIAMGALVGFDISFILNPSTCLLTPTCTTQSEIINLQFIMTNIAPFKNYTFYDSKKLFLEIQVGCAGLALLLSIIYVIIYIVCKNKLKNQTTSTSDRVIQNGHIDYPAPQPIHRSPQAYPPPQISFIPNQSPYAPPY
ncbi:unnamed protein product [Didymodactylos carnosus]|uniref:Uncharacterized protein n=1 Tax=Didymodactylos carnosus TaxID=1234261 RepID=A0A814HGE1_9BILA|nr:unnamed protein product [Didymodactylos carnosus]CAF1010586.1 unnamed protein product [Didymodactylos carnosus]CAF3730945.1 unnamed protein product [Didymodactylos carnosus]CAF3781891.1 unnamed protein product [Didymodactylos carnosus]